RRLSRVFGAIWRGRLQTASYIYARYANLYLEPGRSRPIPNRRIAVSDVGDITQIIVRYLSDTGIKVNTFGFICVTNVANGLSNLESAFRTAMIKNTSGGLLYAVSSFYSVDSLLVEDVKPGTAASYESSFTAVSGADTGDPLPPQCASVFSLRTGLKGRSYRGRFFLPATSETNQANGAVIGAYTTKLNTISPQLSLCLAPLARTAIGVSVLLVATSTRCSALLRCVPRLRQSPLPRSCIRSDGASTAWECEQRDRKLAASPGHRRGAGGCCDRYRVPTPVLDAEAFST